MKKKLIGFALSAAMLFASLSVPALQLPPKLRLRRTPSPPWRNLP